MKVIENLQRQRFGRLMVLAVGQPSPSGRTRWQCICDCGEAALIQATNLKNGHTVSCGCLRRESTSKRRKKHGFSNERLYNAWLSMRRRCESESSHAYKWYGGRGIKVCDRWQLFENFMKDMGTPPSPKHSLDRIDCDGNYEPGNCRWATMKDQQRNRRNNVLYEFKGSTATLGEHCEGLGIKAATVRARIKRGLTIEQAMSNRPYQRREANETYRRLAA